MPRTNQQVSQIFLLFFCIKHKHHQLQKKKRNPPPEHTSRGLFLWVYWIGLWIDHKNSISKGSEDPWGLSLFRESNKTDSNTGSPADTCGRGVPEGLEMSPVFSPAVIRAWWKQLYISPTACTQIRGWVGSKQQRKEEKKKTGGLEQRTNEGSKDLDSCQTTEIRTGWCGRRRPYVCRLHWHTFNLHAVAYL